MEEGGLSGRLVSFYRRYAFVIGFLFVAGFVGVLLVTTQSPQADVLTGSPNGKSSHVLSDAEAQKVASANGLYALKSNEFAVIKKSNGKKLAKTAKNTITLASGQQVPVEADQESTVSVIEGSDTANKYVKLDDTVTIHSKDEITSAEAKDKIDPAIGRHFKTQQTVPVIIQMNTGFDTFYEAGQSDDKITTKNNKFNDVKTKVAALTQGKGKLKQDLKIINGVSADISSDALAALSNSPEVKKVELDRTVTASLDTSLNDIYAKDVWGFVDNSGATLTGNGMRIAVIDTGVDYTHPDLGGCLGANCKVIGGHDYVNNDNDPMDDMGHGTHVAATAAGKGLLNGVAPDAKIIAYKVLDANGSGYFSAIIAAINASVDPNGDGNSSDHVAVATMSLGADGGNPDDSQSLAVDNASAAGVVSTIAAGNSGPALSTIGSPGTARTAITVAAACKSAQVGTTCTNPIANFSSRGPLLWNGVDIQKPDVAAPGVLICAARWATSFSGAQTCFDDKHIRISGTSMATPHVAGAVALIRQANPNYTPAQVKQLLKTTARNLGSGTTYNDQGAGEINIKAAIPTISKFTATPINWTLSSDPTKKLSTPQQAFSITPVDASISSLAVSFDTNVPGVTGSSSKSTLSVANKTTDSFTATLTIDNDVAQPGIYFMNMYFKDNGVLKGTVPIFLTIKPTFSVSPDKVVDYGNDDPTLTTWASAIQKVTVSNLRTDKAVTLSVTPPAYPSGVTFTGPTSVTVPAGTSTTPGTASIDTKVTVTNAALANDDYNGSLALATSTQTTSVVTKFHKFYVLVVQDTSNPADLANANFVSAHDRVSQSFFVSGQSPATLYLKQPGTYDVLVQYKDSNCCAQEYTVIREGIALTTGTTTITTSRADAKNQVLIKPTDAAGNSVDLGLAQRSLTFTPNPLLVNTWTENLGGTVNGFYFSSVGSNYRYRQLNNYPTYGPTADDYDFYAEFNGLQNALTVTNTPSDFRKFNWHLDIDQQGGAINPGLTHFIHPNIGAGAWWTTGGGLSLPVRQTEYSLMPARPDIISFYEYGDSAAYNESPWMTHENPPARWIYPYVRNSNTVLMPPLSGDTIYTGLGPSVWTGKFQNASQTMSIDAYYMRYWGAPLLLRQDLSRKSYAAFPYSVFSGTTQIASGTFAAASGWINTGTTNVRLPSPGKYQFKATFPYTSRAVGANGSVVANFDTTLSDPNPPAIKRLNYWAGDKRSEVYDSALTNKVELEFDPVGGSMGAVTATYAANGGAAQNATVSSTNGVYTAIIPANVATSGKVAVTVVANDNSNNSLSHTFELPAGSVVPPDSQAPTVKITSPTSGATVGGTVNITATATDNTAVSKVEFYLDTTLLGSSATSPYAFAWNSAQATAGSHSLTAKAYDPNGNVGTATISITIPAISLTNPANGATVKGGSTVTITAAAAPGTAPTKVEFYSNAGNSVFKLLCTVNAAPYNCAWKVPNKRGVTYNLSAKAYLPDGTTSTSQVVTVKAN